MRSCLLEHFVLHLSFLQEPQHLSLVVVWLRGYVKPFGEASLGVYAMLTILLGEVITSLT